MKIIPDDLLLVLDYVMAVYKCTVSKLSCDEENSLILQPVNSNKIGPNKDYVVSFMNELRFSLESQGISCKYQASLDVLRMDGDIYRIKITDTGS